MLASSSGCENWSLVKICSPLRGSRSSSGLWKAISCSLCRSDSGVKSNDSGSGSKLVDFLNPETYITIIMNLFLTCIERLWSPQR